MGEQRQTKGNAMCLTEEQSCTWVVAGLVAALIGLVEEQIHEIGSKKRPLCAGVAPRMLARLERAMIPLKAKCGREACHPIWGRNAKHASQPILEPVQDTSCPIGLTQGCCVTLPNRAGRTNTYLTGSSVFQFCWLL